MISEHRARFCMMILDKLQDRLPVVAAFLPMYEALLKRAGVQTLNGTNLSVCPATGSLMQDCLRRPDQESDLGGPDPPEGSFDQVLQDSLSSTLPFSFPFGNLFEDIFLSSPPRSTSFCDDNMAVP
jgi:hypothetical protein